MNPSNDHSIARYVLEASAVLALAVLAAIVVALHFTRPPITYAQEQMPGVGTTVRARVEKIEDETQSEDAGGLVTVYQKLTLRILSPGPYQGEVITTDYNGMGPTLSAVRFREGRSALVMISEIRLPQSGAQGGETDSRVVYQIADHVRLAPLAMATALFAVVTIAIGRRQGFRALLGLALSALFIGAFILPQILAHRDPVLITLVGVGLLIAATLYLIQGWNVAGHTALLGLLISLAVTGLLAIAWTEAAYLTGFGSEETLFLQATGINIEMRGLLLAGIILGTAGVLDDVVIAQAVTVFELSAARPDAHFRTLMRSGMKIGVSHLTSMVNTLVLAYAGTALPLFILFYLYPEPWYLTINRELIAEEIIRTLVGSVGLMLAVPLTTGIAAWVAPQFHPPQPPPSPDARFSQ